MIKKQLRAEPRGSSESKSTQGTKVIADSIGMLTLISFPYKNELFHITTDYNKTYVSKIENGQFVHLQEISSVRLGALEPKAYKRIDGHYLVRLTPGETIGLLDIIDMVTAEMLFSGGIYVKQNLWQRRTRWCR